MSAQVKHLYFLTSLTSFTFLKKKQRRPRRNVSVHGCCYIDLAALSRSLRRPALSQRLAPEKRFAFSRGYPAVAEFIQKIPDLSVSKLPARSKLFCLSPARSNAYIALYAPSSITTAFGLLLGSPSALQVMPSPVRPSMVI